MPNPMFQHRHYAAIAAVLADARDNGFNDTPTIEWLEERLAKLFERDNGNFDPARFLKAARRAPDMHGKDKR